MMQKGKVENVKQEMERMKINILRLFDMRWKGAGCIASDGYKICTKEENITTKESV